MARRACKAASRETTSGGACRAAGGTVRPAGGLLRQRLDADRALVLRALHGKRHRAVDQRVQRVVLADADVAARVHPGAALADDDRAGRDDFAAVLDAIRTTGALERTRAAARAESLAACAAIAGLRDSNYRRSLLDLATFAVERTY